jgi:serine/threonine protein kinase
MDRPVTPTSLETVAETALAAAAAASGQGPGPASDISQLTSQSSSVVEEGRFAPGTLLGGRYRILGLLGRGGMGEVYRATDLMLGQAVALKFLPEEASQNPRLLERFHGEVRVARLVSHPNVCRVFDIGEVDGTPFISMEYVDGEDLASLLLRIGRLPADKAMETARKLCAGLAAAHDRGVIHRDFKPQNIMINKRGDAVIMDFGLAAIADQLSGAEVRNGTPAYMAPEQLKGAGVTHRSDIYALGLVLYELFTGRKPYDAKTLQQLIDLQESAQLTSMTSVAADIDPAVDKVIRRCLEPDPLKRPQSALAVAAALPGGDPLAAALAAGETPSPEMVASAGKVEGLPRKYSIPCVAVIVLSLVAGMWYLQKTRAVANAPSENPPEVLAHQSRQIAASFGYPNAPADSYLWLEHRGELVHYLNRLPRPRNWTAWFAADAPLRANYREAPFPLIGEPMGHVDAAHPPLDSPGMADVVVDGNGKLLRFSAVPPDGNPMVPAVSADAVFRAAGFDRSTFHEIAPTLVPAHASDSLLAWSGPHPVIPKTEITVQIAAFKGRVTEVAINYPYNPLGKPGSGNTTAENTVNAAIQVLSVAGALFVALVARRNWKSGRTDRNGALRVAGARFVIGLLAWAGSVHPIAELRMLDLFEAAASDLLGTALFLWLVYVAIEPAVRARYPHSIVTWNRLLAGRWLDAQVWSDVLIGGALGSFIIVGANSLNLIGNKDAMISAGNLPFLLDTRHWWGGYFKYVSESLNLGLFVFATVCGLRRMVRYDLLAALVTAVIFAATEGVFNRVGVDMLIDAALMITIYAILAYVLMRIGLIATMSLIFFVNLFNSFWLGANWKMWFAPAGIATLLLALGITLFAFWRSLGGRELLGSGEDLAR